MFRTIGGALDGHLPWSDRPLFSYAVILLGKVILFLIVVSVSSGLAQDNLPSLIKKIQPSVVTITTFDDAGNPTLRGTGFFISEEGDVLTNLHVIEGAAFVEVRTLTGETYTGTKVVAEDKNADLVRLSVTIPHGAVEPLLVSSVLPEVGERILVIGSPFGLEQTVSDGIVSAVREVKVFGHVIQITAPISQGSSGSPVVNMSGEVIGVATFQFVEGQNLNFAIPGNRVKLLLAQYAMHPPPPTPTRSQQCHVPHTDSLPKGKNLLNPYSYRYVPTCSSCWNPSHSPTDTCVHRSLSPPSPTPPLSATSFQPTRSMISLDANPHS